MSDDEFTPDERDLNPFLLRLVDMFDKVRNMTTPKGQWKGYSFDKPSELIFTWVMGKYFLDEKNRIIVNAKVKNKVNEFIKWLGFKEIRPDFEFQKIFAYGLRIFGNFSITPVGSQIVTYGLGAVFIVTALSIIWFLEQTPIRPAKDKNGEQIYTTEEIECREDLLNIHGEKITFAEIIPIQVAIQGRLNPGDTDWWDAIIQTILDIAKALKGDEIEVERSLLILSETFAKARLDPWTFYAWLLKQRENKTIKYKKYLTIMPPFLHNLYFTVKSIQAYLWGDQEGMSDVFESWGLTDFAKQIENLEHSSPIYKFMSSSFASGSGIMGLFNIVKDIVTIDDEEYYNSMDDMADNFTEDDLAFLRRYLGIFDVLGVHPTEDVPEVSADDEETFTEEETTEHILEIEPTTLEDKLEELQEEEEEAEPETILPDKPEETTLPDKPEEEETLSDIGRI